MHKSMNTSNIYKYPYFQSIFTAKHKLFLCTFKIHLKYFKIKDSSTQVNLARRGNAVAKAAICCQPCKLCWCHWKKTAN